MKKLFTLLFCAVTIVASAQFAYQTSTGMENTYDDTEGTTFMLPPSNGSMSFPNAIGFSFDYWGNTYTNYKVSENGYLSFGTSASTSENTNVDLSAGTAPTNAIFAFWDSFQMIAGSQTNAADEVRSYTYGEAPNRTHVVQWVSMTPESPGPSTYTYFAIRLHECGNFDIIHSRAGAAGFSATIGATGPTAADYVQIGSGMEDFPVIAFQGMTTADFKIHRFYPGATYPVNDVATADLSFPTINEVGSHTISGTVKNAGSSTVTSLEMNYAVDGGTTVTETMTVNIAPNAEGTYTFSTPFTSVSNATHSVEVWPSKVNGVADDFDCNDKGVGSFNVYTALTDRKPLHEGFTSSTCNPCVAGNQNVKSVIEATAEEEVFVKYQMSWPGNGDPYYTDEGGDRRNYYGINAVPYMMMDGGWNQNSASYSSAVYQEYKSVGALFDLSGEYSIDATNQTIGIDLTIDPASDVNSNLTLYVALVERLTEKNVGTNGETEFSYVFKKMVPGSTGESLGSTFTAGTQVNKKFIYVFNGSYTLPADAGSPINHTNQHSVEEFQDLLVVFWVQDDATKFIHQSEYATLVTSANGIEGTVDPSNPFGPALSVSNQIKADGYSIYPNPASDFVNVNLNGEFNNLTMIDALGKVVYSENVQGINFTSIDTEILNNGIYLLQLESNGNIVTERVVIR